MSLYFDKTRVDFDFTQGTIRANNQSKPMGEVLKFWEKLNRIKSKSESASPELKFSVYDLQIPTSREGFSGWDDGTKIKFGCQTGTYGQIKAIVKAIEDDLVEKSKPKQK